MSALRETLVKVSAVGLLSGNEPAWLIMLKNINAAMLLYDEALIDEVCGRMEFYYA